MRTETVIESKTTPLELTEAQALSLEKTGQQLAKGVSWRDEPEDDDESQDRTLIKVTRGADGRWAVTVRDAVGLVAVDDLQIQVEPKIPTPHLLWLWSHTDRAPTMDEQIAEAAEGSAFWKLVARWYLSELTDLLRRDLMRDYQQHHDELALIRGRLDPRGTATNYYKGALRFPCEFDEFNTDTPLNRILLAAAVKISSLSALETDARQHAKRLAQRMDGISTLRPPDLNASLSRNTVHYRPAVLLARHILGDVWRLPAHGSTYGTTFLIRTAKLVEEGIRNALRSRLAPCGWKLRPRGGRKPLTPSRVTVNPDLVFDNCQAVGDIKYKLASGDWSRSDLNQNVTFATAYGASCGVVVGFRNSDAQPTPPTVAVGPVTISYIAWDAFLTPDHAADRLAQSMHVWLMTDPIERQVS